jgi:aerobic carbon-monoxide dehydrogenase medium subunit
MKPAAFDYVCPKDLAAATKALAAANGAGKLIAGGQSLGPMLNLRLARPDLLIDVARIAELRSVEDCGTFWRIGAATTHAEIEDGVTPVGAAGLLPYMARRIAYRAVRNRGTIGGSLAHADPAGDWPLALAALDAVAEIHGPPRARRQKVADLIVGAFTTTLADDEIIVAIEVPKPSAGARWGTFKLCRKAGEFPIASAVVVLDPERAAAAIYLGALSDRPRPLPELSRQLLRHGIRNVSPAILAEAIAQAAPDIDAVDRRIHVGCLARAVEQALA